MAAETPPLPAGLQRFGRAYTAVANLLLGTLIAFAAINAGLYLFPSLRAEAAVDTPMRFFGIETLLPVYPGWAPNDLVQLHAESRVVFEYKPVLQFRIRPISGTYVNATTEGYRVNAHQAPWPPRRDALNVFVFGGSTTFGWLLADKDTIVSQLQDQAQAAACPRPVAVYNFGHPSYISTQEALLFQSLIMADTAPDVAVFVDGFNDFFFRGEPSFTPTLRAMMDGSDLHHIFGSITQLPLYELARRLRARYLYRPPVLAPDVERQQHESVIAQWRRNKKLIEETGQLHGTRTVFVWQPVPTYKYDLGQHFLYRREPVAPGEEVPYADIGRAYGVMSAHRAELEAQGNFLWLADMQEDVRENLYVDRVHYTAKASGEIARRILQFLNASSLLGCS
ncbi:MAG: hypothetical protein ABL993_03745 [Vicinamibacterales bacterium]